MAATNPPIHFHFLTSPVSLEARTALKRFLSAAIRKEGKQIDAINYIFVSDEYLLELNQTHLNHDTYTDIITFELSPRGEPLLSDIYISVDRVRENARTYGTSFKQEIHRVIFHGALHLCGYKDKSAKQGEEMRRMEESWIRLYFVPRGT